MKKMVLWILFLFLLSSTILLSQQGWFSINKIANGNSLSSVCFNKDSIGYTVSNEGFILTSNDLGNSWDKKKLTESSLNDIFFIDDLGFIVGDDGNIFKSTDGINWNKKSSYSTQNLNSVYFLDADTGYAFGNGSTILKTINGGESWTNLNLISNLLITDGAFSTPNFGFCTTSEGVLIRTTDYGQSWYYIGFGEYYSFYSLFFSNDTTAYFTGWEYDLGFILKTEDRGINFQYLYPEVFVNINSSYFISSNLGYAVGDRGFISKTTDSGNTWETQFNQSNKNLNSVFFTDSLIGFAVGEDSTILKTTNAGLNWELMGSGFTSQLMALHFPQKNIGFAVGTNGEVYKITNNNASLIYREESIYNAFYFVHFMDSLIGFTGGSNGKFFSTTDGGNSWQLTDFRSQDVISMSAIDFYQNQIGIVSANDKLLRTVNGGQSWSVISSNTSSFDVIFLNETTLISVGIHGAIHKSTNGGLTWQVKNSPTNQSLKSVDFTDENIGFAVGWNGTIIKTTDAGDNWSSLNLPFTETLWKIKFINQSNGYIIGYEGQIFFTSDGGDNWSEQHSTTNENLNDIFFLDNLTGYIIGNSGTLIKTINGGIVSVEKSEEPLQHFRLSQNYPNPFNPSTKISWQSPVGSWQTLKVYDILGNEVATLVDEYRNAGSYEVDFNPVSSIKNLASGIYFYRLRVGDPSSGSGQSFVETKKMILLK